MHPTLRNMQQDRIDGAFETMSYEKRKATLAQIGADNAVPDLPVSPCVKIKATGEIHTWTPFFAKRPDICVNCDEQGREEVEFWSGRGPVHRGGSVHALKAEIQRITAAEREEAQHREKEEELRKVAPPKGLQFYLEQFSTGETPGAVPQMEMASAILGIPQEKAQSYTSSTAVKAAMPIVDSAGASITDVVKRNFEAVVHI